MPDPYSEALWGATTPPADHDPDNFRYLVHMDTGINVTRFFKSQTRYFHTDPLRRIKKPKKRKLLSASLISTDKRSTIPFTSHGVILETPPEGVALTSTRDTYSKFIGYDRLTEIYDRVLDPDELLDATKADHHNEVLLDPTAVSVVGLIFVLTPRMFSLCPVDLNTLRNSAERHDLPLVEI